MGISNFHSQAEGVLPVIVVNTVLSLVLFKNMIRSAIFQVVGANYYGTNHQEFDFEEDEESPSSAATRVLITRYGSLMWKKEEEGTSTTVEDHCCCVCLCKFRQEEEVSELSYCHHFFHKICLQKWFDNQHTTCPLCRSAL